MNFIQNNLQLSTFNFPKQFPTTSKFPWNKFDIDTDGEGFLRQLVYPPQHHG